MSERIATREGVIVVRVWFEDHPTHPLRAVVNASVDGVRVLERASAKTVDEVCDAVLLALAMVRESELRPRA